MRFLRVASVLLVLLSFCMAKDQPSTADFVKQHLASIGTDQARAAAKNRVAEGSVKFEILNRGGSQDGKAVLVSDGNKLVALLKLPNPSYHGERFVSDGKKVMVAQMTPGNYSTFGSFVWNHSEVLTEGLLGGTLSTAWPLANLEERRARLQDRGTRKIDGKELRVMQYMPAKRSDLEILLYMDPETGRHVMTSYWLEIGPQLASSELENAKQSSTQYRLEERFDDFKIADGLQLPNHWTVQFTAQIPMDPRHPGRVGLSLQSGISQFNVTENTISHNVPVDARNFEIK